jgi:predicted RNA-binding Zn ribbon-like protein
VANEPALAAAGRFALGSGAVCLDFANTWGDRERPESDRLTSYPSLLAFAAQAGLVGRREAATLLRGAGEAPAGAAAALAVARRLRDALYGVFAAQARGRRVPAADLDTLNTALRAALPHLEVRRRGGRYAWAWQDRTHLASPLRPIARSAAELLTGADLGRVRECDGATCTWLFLDQSRNRSRRWCSMESCGNRAKAQRHYHRQREADSDDA